MGLVRGKHRSTYELSYKRSLLSPFSSLTDDSRMAPNYYSRLDLDRASSTVDINLRDCMYNWMHEIYENEKEKE